MKKHFFTQLWQHFFKEKFIPYITFTNYQVKHLVDHSRSEQHTISNFLDIKLKFCNQQQIVQMYEEVLASGREARFSLCMEWESLEGRDLDKMYFILIDLCSHATVESLTTMFFDTVKYGDVYMFDYISQHHLYDQCVLYWVQKNQYNYPIEVQILSSSLRSKENSGNKNLPEHLLTKKNYRHLLSHSLVGSILFEQFWKPIVQYERVDLLEKNFHLLLDNNCNSSEFYQQLNTGQIKGDFIFSSLKSQDLLLKKLQAHSLMMMMEKSTEHHPKTEPKRHKI